MDSQTRYRSVLDSDVRRDLMSQLPSDIKDRILEHLPTRDAARTATLSTQWNDVWLRHGELVFDYDFFFHFRKKKSRVVANVIDHILLQSVGPVKKFTLHTDHLDYKPKHSHINRWCAFLSRSGIEQLNLSIFPTQRRRLKLPSCIFSCPTIKQLNLIYLQFRFPESAAHLLLSGFTSLVFECVEFKPNNANGIVFYSIPNLEKLLFDKCRGVNHFEVSAPKLKSLSTDCCPMTDEDELRFLGVHWKVIETLSLFVSLPDPATWIDAVEMLPTAKNMKVIKLTVPDLSLGNLICLIGLIGKSPELHELEIMVLYLTADGTEGDDLKRYEESGNYLIKTNLKMLRTVKLDVFLGTRAEIFFVKAILSRSPALRTFVIHVSNDIESYIAFKIATELLSFPRASPEAQLIFSK